MSQSNTLYGIAPEQYGVRKAKSSHIKSLNTRLFYNLIRQKRIPATNICVDMISNYDLVVYNIAYLSLQRVDVTKEPILCTFTTLQNMSYSVRTDFGGSKSTYGVDTWYVPLNPPPQEIVQGNGSAPTIQAILITPLLNCLRKVGHSTAYKRFVSWDTTKLVGYCLVDNFTVVQVATSPNSPTEYTVKMSQEGRNIFAGA